MPPDIFELDHVGMGAEQSFTNNCSDYYTSVTSAIENNTPPHHTSFHEYLPEPITILSK